MRNFNWSDSMTKDKQRHNPDKPQNNYGSWCSYYEEYSNGSVGCERGLDVSVCKGNPHNCIKIKYKELASRSDRQKIED